MIQINFAFGYKHLKFVMMTNLEMDPQFANNWPPSVSEEQSKKNFFRFFKKIQKNKTGRKPFIKTNKQQKDISL